MAISEQARHQLHQKLEQFIGPKEAATLMEHLPPRGWGDVATKADLDHLAALTKADVDRVGVLIKADIDRVGAEVVQLAALTKRDMEALEARLGARIDSSIRQTTEAFYKELAANARTVVFACIGAVMTSSGLAFAAARF